MTRRERILLGILVWLITLVVGLGLAAHYLGPEFRDYTEARAAERRGQTRAKAAAARPDPGWVVNGVAKEHCKVVDNEADRRYCQAERLSWTRDPHAVTLHWRRVVADCAIDFALVGTREGDAYKLDPVVMPGSGALCYCNYDFGARLPVGDALPVVVSLPSGQGRLPVTIAAGVGQGESVVEASQSPACLGVEWTPPG